jgi:hypothetical protein
LPRPNGVLRLSTFIRDLLLGGALPFGHCQILTPDWSRATQTLAAQIISNAHDRRLSHRRRLETSSPRLAAITLVRGPR